MMDIETVARTIQLILAPVVMVTACAITLTGLLARYAAINDRLRLMMHERLDLVANKNSLLRDERLQQIDRQIPLLLRHHKLAHDALLFVYYAVAVFIADMFVIALAVVSGIALLTASVLIFFLTGTGLLFTGIVLTALEVRTSHEALHYEVRRITNLRNDTAPEQH
jgi:hypothetical protein